MSSTSFIRRRSVFWQRFFWAGVAILFAVLLIINAFAWSQLPALQQEISLLQQEYELQNQDQARAMKAQTDASQAFYDCKQTNEELFSMFRWCKSKTEFASLVSGNEIISYSPIYASPDDWTWIYVPEGKHTLKIAGESFWGNEGSRDFLMGEAAQLETLSIELQPASVFELEIAKLDRTESLPVEISIRSLDGTASKVTVPDLLARGPWTNHENVKFGVRKLPGEVGPLKGMLNGTLTADLQRQYCSPVHDVILRSCRQQRESETGQLEKGTVAFRCWIESESLPCVSAIRVAANLHRYRVGAAAPMHLNNMNNALQTFESYDGSGRYYFLPGFLKSHSRSN